MNRLDAEAALFSLKTLTAAITAYYFCLRIGFPQPVWAITTAYFVSQPLAGQVLSKGFYRMLGTLLGGAAAVVLLPAFVNEPLVLTFVLALWLGVCVYVALLDRKPRSYVFLLAGYTASIIGFPNVMSPGSIFNTAVLRVQEIGICIVTTSVIHSLVLPRTVTNRLLQQVLAVVADIEQLSRRSLAGIPDAVLDLERKRLASSVNSVEQLTYHVAYDTASLVPQTAAIRALRDQISWLVPLSASVEDRIAEYRALEGAVPPEVGALLSRIDSWFAGSLSSLERDQVASELVSEAERIEKTISVHVTWRWREILLLGLLARLVELVVSHRVLRELRDHLLSGNVRNLSLEALRLIKGAGGSSLHRDHGLAMRSALAAAIAVCAVCGFWIATSWPNGATAALLVGLLCAIASTLPYPGAASRASFFGILTSTPIAAVYGFVVFPRVTDFVTLAAVIAPLLLVLGSLMARLTLFPFALGTVVGFVNSVGFTTAYQSSFQSFINTAIAQALGAGAAAFMASHFQVIGAQPALARLFRAGFRDIAARAAGQAPDTARWVSRMFDRMALIAGRSGLPGAQQSLPAYEALLGVRIGYLAGELHAFSSTAHAGEERRSIDEALREITAHYRSIEPTRRQTMGSGVLAAIDRAMAALAIEPQRERRLRGTVLLTSLRRALFPSAGTFGGTVE